MIKLSSLPIRRKLQVVALILMVFLLAFQLVVQGLFMQSMRSLYMANVTSAINRVSDELRALVTRQEAAITHIAGEEDVPLYASAPQAATRYHLAYSSIRLIVRSAVQNLPIDDVIIYDAGNAWYQFIGSCNYQTFRTLRDTFAPFNEITSMLLVIDGDLNLCSAMPIMVAENRRLRKDGMIVGMINAKTVRAALPDDENLHNATIMLHDGETILLSQDRALEGQPLSDGPVSESRYYVSSDTILPDLHITVSLPHDRIFPEQSLYILAITMVALFTLLALIVTLSLSGRWFSKPISQVLEQMGDAEDGIRLSSTGVTHIDTLVDGVNALLTRQEEAKRDTIQAQQMLYETELAHQQTQMMLLKKQINAHFLYNSLTGIKALTDIGENKKAGKIAQGVAMMMRYSHNVEESVDVFDEMEIIQRYVQIMNIRFNDRFKCTFDVDDNLMGRMMPRLLLQPLVENALTHGLEKQSGDCSLSISGKLIGNAMVFEIVDNGVGIPTARLNAIRMLFEKLESDYPYMQTKGISLGNIEKRVRAAFAPGSGLSIQSKEGEGTRVTLKLITNTQEGEN